MSGSTLVEKPTIFERDTLEYDNDKNFVGAGEFGEVFRATLRQTGDVVAVKVLNTPQRLKQIELDALMKEASILQRLRGHVNVVQLKGICVNPRHYALVLEYVDNGNLEDLLLHEREKQPIVEQWNCRCSMGLDVARGMLYIHNQKDPITHRDLKSSNVLVTQNYRCKISDFGLAKMRGISSQTTRRSRRGRQNPSGTLSFIAPERFTGETDPTKGQKIDVYGFAIVLWQLKEMARPYASENSASTIRENVIGGVRPKISEDHSCPPGLVQLIKVCWSTRPDARPDFMDIKNQLVEVVRSFESDTATGSEPMNANNAFHAYSSRGGPVATPVDTINAESLQGFGSGIGFPLQQDPRLPQPSTFSLSGVVGMMEYQHQSIETGSMPPTMSHINQPVKSQYLTTGSTHGLQQAHLTSGSFDHQSRIMPAGQLVSAPDQTSTPSSTFRLPHSQMMRDAVAEEVPLPGVAPPVVPDVSDHFWSLKYNWQLLLDNLVVDYVIDQMFSQISMFSMDDMEKITSPRTRLEKAKQLLYWLMGHSANEYHVFLDALKESQRHLYARLILPVPEGYKMSQPVGSDSRVVYQPPHASQLPHQEAGAAGYRQSVRPPTTSEAQLVRPPPVMPTVQPQMQQMPPTRQPQMHQPVGLLNAQQMPPTGQSQRQQPVRLANAQQMSPSHHSGQQPAAFTAGVGNEGGSQVVQGASGFRGSARQAVPVMRRHSIEECIQALGENEELNEFNSRDLFVMLSANLGHEWKPFARYLGLRSAAIENIEADNLSQRERSYQVLIQWTRQGTASRTALYNAIMSADPSGALMELLIVG